MSKIWAGDLEVISFVVADKIKKITFYESNSAEGSFSPEFRHETRNNHENPLNMFEIETRTIDGIIPEDDRVTIIKMDVEGAEYEALLGAERTIKMYKPRLAISI